MSELNGPKLVIAISSTALFDMRESHEIYESQGVAAYSKYQREHEDDILEPGEAFPLVTKLLRINEKLGGEPRVEVILLSRNSADTGLRVFNSIAHHGLNITRAAFSGGNSPYRYVSAFACHLFLSTNAQDVRSALDSGMAAATLLPSQKSVSESDELRFAFDGDAVLFSDASERIFKERGLDAFTANEKAEARMPLDAGPFKIFLQTLHSLQAEFPIDECPIRTALVTARAAPAHERVVRTLREWGIRIDESLFLGGLSKGDFLKSFGADVFFDDQQVHCSSASEHVATGHVPHGVANELKE
ncbi:5'-nucleotidase [gamma proteobacterium HTCC2207]|jgi:5'-nucleotidase|uniref:5'-nucleotidase n=1 Tax=gamma proteobacterium HTCC2207 TaxID=314287 RepID=Q1YTN4_9GAMM|nr:5'-nucleotidase [gamma proteobacterium HTCC2207]MBT5104805.1 5'-nucleotidase [Porticoccaceae bacterium]MBT6115715.1 5'-nucleotidase [Porticoccaceae bacterium]MBT6592452.1 5'-nucleotidase [Porticoccaceae bacterium]MDG1079858.1 5'-nucleotidase [Porticoccaceae bacterium]